MHGVTVIDCPGAELAWVLEGGSSTFSVDAGHVYMDGGSLIKDCESASGAREVT